MPPEPSALRAEARTNVVCSCCALATAISWLRHCTLDMSIQRRQTEALSTGYDTIVNVWQCLFAVYTARTMPFCHFLKLLQSILTLVTSFSWSIWTLYCLRQPSRSKLGPTKIQCWLKCIDLCSMVGLLKSQIIGVQQNWKS